MKEEYIVPVNEETDFYWNVFPEKIAMDGCDIIKLTWGINDHQILMTRDGAEQLRDALNEIL